MKATSPSTPYDDEFYRVNVTPSLNSAKFILSHLREIYPFKSVVDVGCGRGTWLAAAHALGAQTVWGYDGPWVDPSDLLHPGIEFRQKDLAKPLVIGRKFDLAISVEVAEHLPDSVAMQFVKTLTDAAEVVVFGAAFVKQGGTNHINEQMPSYWGEKFRACDYLVFDFFRPKLWGADAVDLCYRQNTFLYIKKSFYEALCNTETLGKPIEHLEFMNCMHPGIYLHRSLSFAICEIVPAAKRTIVTKLRRYFR